MRGMTLLSADARVSAAICACGVIHIVIIAAAVVSRIAIGMVGFIAAAASGVTYPL